MYLYRKYGYLILLLAALLDVVDALVGMIVPSFGQPDTSPTFLLVTSCFISLLIFLFLPLFLVPVYQQGGLLGKAGALFFQFATFALFLMNVILVYYRIASISFNTLNPPLLLAFTIIPMTMALILGLLLSGITILLKAPYPRSFGMLLILPILLNISNFFVSPQIVPYITSIGVILIDVTLVWAMGLHFSKS